ncbi:hypothetical protein KDK95_30255 [Actinospica sp. MGRD01-02]|uniref:Uncharacterized protein n=1 Tax=Actinospica acidithermotolerans TaxID=2828514 RepID=A0A941IN32_9ACTN|nr:hypothetical protein [Actinospica acidithermotolerans]MBR7830623.1 hypothetical protein [Actinospica acidithermotolerans]
MNQTPETTETDTAPGAANNPVPTPTGQDAASTLRAVLAIPFHRYDDDRWAGRILEYAPGPAETVRALREILGKRHKGRHRVREAISELIYDHPVGWERLGPDPNAPGGARRARERAPGACRCHLPDGTPRPGLTRAERQALVAAEWGRAAVRGEAPALDPGGDGAPWRISGSSTLPARVEHVFLLDGDVIEVFARDDSADRNNVRDGLLRGFSPVARVHATRPMDWAEFGPRLDAASAEVRSRPRTDWNRVHAVDALTRAAKELESVPAHADLLLYMLGKHTGQEGTRQMAEGALAEAGGVHGAELPALLLRASRAEQVRLLREAARLMDRPDTAPPHLAPHPSRT